MYLFYLREHEVFPLRRLDLDLGCETYFSSILWEELIYENITIQSINPFHKVYICFIF